MKQIFNKIIGGATKAACLLVVAGMLAMSTAPALKAVAATTPTFTSGAKVSFTFDDGLSSALLAAQTLQPYGYTGTDYVITNCVGLAAGTAANPNSCAADGTRNYMSWSDIATLQNTYGWQIASHTQNHPQLSTDRLNGIITAQQMIDEINGSKTVLNSHGFAANDFADPYGDYDNTSITQIAKTYTSHRGFADIDYNTFPYNDYLLTVQQIQGDVGGANIAKAKAYIDQAKAQGKWLIMVFHEIKASGASTALADYEYNASDLATLAAYVQSQGLPVTDIAHGLANSNTNLFANGNFNNGIADGWTTDDPTGIKADNGNNGSYDGTATGATNSISLSGSAADTHLFSPTVAVDPTQSYVFKNFVNVTSTSGEVDFYIDEYDANGVDLKTGKYFAGVAGSTVATTVAVKNVNFAYTPSSAAVAKVRLQTIVHGSATKAFVDNEQLFPQNTIGVTGTVTPPSTKAGDVNGDSKVDTLDLSILLNNWSATAATAAQGDLNGDGTVDILDLSILLTNWSN